MSHNQVYAMFKTIFIHKDMEKDMDTWFPNGKNSIRVRFKNKNEFVFTYFDVKKWSLETVDNFIERTNSKIKSKGEKQWLN